MEPNAEPSDKEKTKNEYDDLDQILEMNEEKSLSVTDVPSYTFEICDILLNIAPCGHSIIGESVGDYSEFLTSSIHIDLVTSSGHTKNGAISILQRSIRPEVIATFRIQDVIDIWSVYNDGEASTASQTYLFLSKIDSTMVLHMANEITELDKDSSVFCTKYPTMYCANLHANKFIIQITSNALFVYTECYVENDGKLVFSYDLTASLDSKMKSAYVCDPYVTILTEKGTILLFKFDPVAKSLKLIENSKLHAKHEQNVAFLSSVSCFSLYKDESRIFSNYQSPNKLDDMDYEMKSQNIKSPQKAASTSKFEQISTEITIDDEDELLYGGSQTVGTADRLG